MEGEVMREFAGRSIPGRRAGNGSEGTVDTGVPGCTVPPIRPDGLGRPGVSGCDDGARVPAATRAGTLARRRGDGWNGPGDRVHTTGRSNMDHAFDTMGSDGTATLEPETLALPWAAPDMAAYDEDDDDDELDDDAFADGDDDTAADDDEDFLEDDDEEVEGDAEFDDDEADDDDDF